MTETCMATNANTTKNMDVKQPQLGERKQQPQYRPEQVQGREQGQGREKGQGQEKGQEHEKGQGRNK